MQDYAGQENLEVNWLYLLGSSNSPMPEGKGPPLRGGQRLCIINHSLESDK